VSADSGVELSTMPFGDASIPALVGANLTSDVPLLQQRGESLARATLRAVPRSDVARPLFSQLDGGTLNALIQAGVRTVLLNPSYLPTPAGLPFAPPPVATLGGGGRTVTAVLPDTGVASVAAAYQSDPVLGAHAVLGEL